MDKLVLDLSTYQGTVDFSKMKSAGVEGVILRCGYTGYGSMLPTTDAKFEAYYKGASEAGLPIGVYYFTLATSEELAVKEANFVLNLVKDKELLLPIYVDVEAQNNSVAWTNLSKSDRTKFVAKFCDTIEKAGYYVGIYGSTSWLNNKLDMSSLKAYDVWVAQYNTRCTYTGNYGMWQYSSKGNGATYGCSSTYVDMNHCYKDYPTIIRKAGLNGYTKTSTVKEFKVGAKVKYSGYVYSDSYGVGRGRNVSGIYEITRYIKGRKCGVHIGSLGWVSESNCKLV